MRSFTGSRPKFGCFPGQEDIRERDVNLQDEAQRSAFLEHARRLVALGADGVHLNIEPVPSGASGYVEFLRAVKAAIGDRTLSVAAYPPPLTDDPDNEAHWQIPFMREVCRSADELAFMAYNTGSASAAAFETLIAAWTRELAAALPSPKAGGCEWLMGVPAYDEEEPYHRPDVETVEHSLKGIAAGLRASGKAGKLPRGCDLRLLHGGRAQMGRLRHGLARGEAGEVAAARSAQHRGIAGGRADAKRLKRDGEGGRSCPAHRK